MARLNVNPTRMELTNLKRKLVTARRGHKLLKDKRDELMRRFMDIVRENKALRRKVEENLRQAGALFAGAKGVLGSEAVDAALLLPMQKMELDVSEKNVMSVMIPQFSAEFQSPDATDVCPYGFAFTSEALDEALTYLSGVMKDLLRLAEMEKSCQLLADEIEKTRRRVNALEHVMIPQYEETIKYVQMKLEENERGATTRIMKVKDMMVQKQYAQNAANGL
ncbi:MAG: V-type ATP synthase subunit D [Clostridia bacterium]|jgi:V/A-type H+-transporting ATPase subunit D|nr:V-type ATP synthase subunit D [Clostridia bacterium]